jgi:hypothetical protein
VKSRYLLALALAATGSALPLYARASSAPEVDADQLNCLATEVYYEARGEGVKGMVAAGSIAMNRARAGRDLCDVTHERSARHCQFSYVCNSWLRIRDEDSWEKAKAVARAIVSDPLLPDPTAGSTEFGVCSYTRGWSRTRFVRQIGHHCFYRREGETALPVRDATFYLNPGAGEGYALQFASLTVAESEDPEGGEGPIRVVQHDQAADTAAALQRMHHSHVFVELAQTSYAPPDMNGAMTFSVGDQQILAAR